MDETILNLSYELKELLNSDPRILTLNEVEKEMENDEEVQLLSLKKDQENSKYNDMVKYYGEKSKEAEKALESFYLAKKALDEHPKVRAYLKAYQAVRLLLEEVNNILFKDYQQNLCPSKKE